jgi:hypothetical protein
MFSNHVPPYIDALEDCEMDILGVLRTTSLFLSKIVNWMPGTLIGSSTPAVIPAIPAPITATCSHQQSPSREQFNNAHLQRSNLVNGMLLDFEVRGERIHPVVIAFEGVFRREIVFCNKVDHRA